jgi:hypothetical protein
LRKPRRFGHVWPVDAAAGLGNPLLVETMPEVGIEPTWAKPTRF